MLGFVSPEGKFYECGYFEHIKLADELLNKVYNQQSNNPVDKLCKNGWVIIQSSFIGFSGDDMYHTPQLTKEQKDWFEENSQKISYDQQISLNLCLEINGMLYE